MSVGPGLLKLWALLHAWERSSVRTVRTIYNNSYLFSVLSVIVMSPDAAVKPFF